MMSRLVSAALNSRRSNCFLPSKLSGADSEYLLSLLNYFLARISNIFACSIEVRDSLLIRVINIKTSPPCKAERNKVPWNSLLAPKICLEEDWLAYNG